MNFKLIRFQSGFMVCHDFFVGSISQLQFAKKILSPMSLMLLASFVPKFDIVIPLIQGLLGLLPKFWHTKLKFWLLFGWVLKFVHFSHLSYQNVGKFFTQHLASQNFGMPKFQQQSKQVLNRALAACCQLKCPTKAAYIWMQQKFHCLHLQVTNFSVFSSPTKISF